MNILHVAPVTMNKSSGLTYSIPNFVKAQNRINDIKSDLLISVNTDAKINGFYYLNDLSRQIDLHNFFGGYDIVVFHSTYILSHIKIAKILRQKNIPYIIVPRGGFSKKSKSIKKTKKIIGDVLLFNRFFKSPNAIHFLTDNERIESCYSTDNDFVIPNGISDSGEVYNRAYNPSKKIKVVYIGRVDAYIKGLDLLVDAINIEKQELRDSNVEVILYGPDSSNSKAKLRRQILNYQIEDLIQIKEAVFGENKLEVLKEADVFVQTSRFEGLPMGVLEALSIGLPCVLTPGTNLADEIIESGAGIAVELTADSIALGILEILKGIKNGKNYSSNAIILSKKYTWESIAKNAINKYKIIVRKD